MKSFVRLAQSVLIFLIVISSGSLFAQKPIPVFSTSIATPPAVVSTSPTRNQLNVLKTTNVTATFNIAMNTSTFNASNILAIGSQSGKHTGVITLNGNTGFTLNPTNDFKAGEAVSINLTSNILSGSGGNLTNGYHWNFFVKATSGTGIYTQTSTPGLGVGAQPVSLVTADFDGDGDIDIATTNQSTNVLSILLNNGAGSFSLASSPSAGTGRTALTAGDFDNDGDIDLAVVGGGASGTAAIMKNDGSGTFTLDASPSTGMGPTAVAAGDLDGDGDIDLVVALNSVNKIAIMMNNGSGTFSVSTSPDVGTGPQSVTIADFNHDGFLDVATANFFSNDASILLNTGAGSFGAAVSASTDNQPNSIASGDVDNDGDVDLVVANQTTNTVSILKNNSSGTFTETSTPSCLNGPNSVAMLDIDADGDLDLAVTRLSGDSVSIYKNSGTGTFSLFSSNAVGSQPYSVAYADFDGDGDNDLTVANRSGASVSILKNNFTAPSVSATTPSRNQIDVASTTNILIRFNQIMDTLTITESANNVLVFGSQSGKHPGTIAISGDTSLLFNSDDDFYAGEVVTVNLSKNIINAAGDSLTAGYHFTFIVAADAGTAVFGISSAPSVASMPVAITSGDFDGDGHLDLAVVNSGSNSTSILINSATGSFPTSSSVNVGSNPLGITAGDFNADGNLDLAVSNSGSNTVSILMNNGSGSFTETSTPATGTTPIGLVSGDVDSDGDIDLIVACQGATSVYVLKNDGTGAFPTSSIYATGNFPVSLAIGDIDADGDLDLVVTNSGTTNVSVMKNNGSGNFSSSTTATVGTTPVSVAAGDIDSDGDLDMIVVNQGSNTISILKNNGSGTFTQSSVPSVDTNPNSVTLGDFDADGDIDAAVANENDNTVSIMKNNGTGTFTKTTISDVNTLPYAVTSADIDNDSDIDLAVAQQSSNTVSILKNNIASRFDVFPFSLNYGDAVLGSGFHKDSVTVTNNGDLALSITSVSSTSTSFVVTPNDGTIAPGDSMRFYISFAPTGLGALTGKIIFTHNDPDVHDTVFVSGTGVQSPVPVFHLSATTVNYGFVQVGSSKHDTVTVSNNGISDPLNIDTVYSDNANVTVTPSNATIASGGMQNFYITYSPSMVETLSANIVFTHNASGSPDTVTVSGIAVNQIPRFYLSLSPDTMTAKKPGKTAFLAPVPRVKKNQLYPNWANLLSEVVLQGGFQANATESDSAGGMRVGLSFITQSGKNKFKAIKDSAAIRGWVRLTKWTFPTTKAAGKGSGFANLQKTLEDKKGKHTGVARGFDSTGVPGQVKPKRVKLVKELTALPPTKSNNKLFGELVALKFNIAASQLGKTPEGFGELLFNVAGNPCDGLHVKEISRKADSAMTYWRGPGQEYYDSLYSAIYAINRAFIGPLDTLSFKANNNLILDGKVDINSSTFLTYDSSAVVTRLTPAMKPGDNFDDFDNDALSIADELPETAELHQNYPNPFNPTTVISYNLPVDSKVTLKIFNILGEEVVTLVNENQDAGFKTVEWDASNLPSGIYVYRIQAGNFSEVKRMVLMK